ncbi:MAG: hypothetical protein KDN20_21395 [Verrucomicrobiae bacterium]|nr:hypothetical protein [Verrucomicrobiae bacterium]
MSRETERARLLRELAESRRQLSGELSDLGHAVNLRERLQDAVRKHPAWWIGGSLAGGLLLANLLRPSRGGKRRMETALGDPVKRSLFLGLLGIAGKQILRLSEPALKRYAEQEVQRWMQGRSSSPQPKQPPTHGPTP